MKAAMLTGPGHFDIRTVPDVRITHASQVLVRVDYAGICGSDLHYYRTGRIGDQVIHDPFVIGHECTGTVIGTGGAVRNLQSGDRVVIEPAVSCGICDQCRTGRPHTCRQLAFLGCPGQLNGAFTEFLIMPESNCLRLSPDLPSVTAVFAEPLSIALYAWEFIKTTRVRQIGILGAGPIGLSILLIASENPDLQTVVTDKVEARLNAALSLGAGRAVRPDILDDASGTPIECDAVFECCGQQEAIDQAVHLLKPGGHLVIVGIPEITHIQCDIHNFRRKEITIHNVRRQNGMMHRAVDFCLNHQNRIEPLISQPFSLEQVQKAFHITEGYKDGIIKAVIDCRNP
ncbi:alcohol dehydrogenase catalytic domain-containing protein [bacterium]|nr:alcohol dehydrogenase catalytic domain-containing protein [bacterium]